MVCRTPVIIKCAVGCADGKLIVALSARNSDNLGFDGIARKKGMIRWRIRLRPSESKDSVLLITRIAHFQRLGHRRQLSDGLNVFR